MDDADKRALRARVLRAEHPDLTELTELVTGAAASDLHWREERWLGHLADLALRLGPDDRLALWPAVERLAGAVEESQVDPDERRRLLRRFAEVHPRPLKLPLGPGGWAAAVRAHLGDAPAPEVVELMRHLTTVGGPRPSKTWRSRCLDLLAPDEARWAARFAFDALVTASESIGSGFALRVFVSEADSDLARGLVWAAALSDGATAREARHRDDARAAGGGEPAAGGGDLETGGDLATGGGDPAAGGGSTVAALARLAERAAGDTLVWRLAGSALNALAVCGGTDAVEALHGLRRTITSGALLKQADTALAVAAAGAGVTAAQLVERNVPRHGLATDGTRTWQLGERTVTLAVRDSAAVRLTAGTGAGRTRLPGDASHVRAVAKEVRRTLAAERARVEALFAVERAWPYEEWARHYRDHPITGAVTRGLVWQAGDGATFLPGDPADPGRGTVRLWHPGRARPEEVAAWRETVTGRRLRQPVKQAFREVYHLTPAEEEAGLASVRFAGHIVDQRRVFALAKGRGWRPGWLGPFHDGGAAEAKKELADGAWRARFGYEAVGGGDDDLAVTGEVRFDRRHGARWRESGLAEVPPRVFSEAMRDVDLFVAVASIAADPAGLRRAGDRHAAYWREAACGELAPSAVTRADALARLLPRTAIAGRCELTPRHLVVRGDLRTYRIHLGTASVLMDPGDVHLCVVPARRARRGLFLPFEEDGLLALILSKAFLLAADASIADASIRRQIVPPETPVTS
ncbi:DUF4132 domain-containing protein [Nonomuraea muscovyensis]|uniref:DUF4132 domain-containing protein n=1 Tax=Nonomuraea muscovyensis TaxID=1124761 RepID=UPI0033FD4542